MGWAGGLCSTSSQSSQPHPAAPPGSPLSVRPQGGERSPNTFPGHTMTVVPATVVISLGVPRDFSTTARSLVSLSSRRTKVARSCWGSYQDTVVCQRNGVSESEVVLTARTVIAPLVLTVTTLASQYVPRPWAAP